MIAQTPEVSKNDLFILSVFFFLLILSVLKLATRTLWYSQKASYADGYTEVCVFTQPVV